MKMHSFAKVLHTTVLGFMKNLHPQLTYCTDIQNSINGHIQETVAKLTKDEITEYKKK